MDRGKGSTRMTGENRFGAVAVVRIEIPDRDALCAVGKRLERSNRDVIEKAKSHRLIARGTVEEKVLELQNSKRELADAIINADNSLIRSLAREDLELLLS